MKRWPKLSATCDIASHFILSAEVSMGPKRDTCEAEEILREAHRRIPFRTALLDAGYDAEWVHVLVRKELGAQSVIPPKGGPKTRKWPRQKYRRQMKRRFFKRLYGQRWQIESVFSRHKRLLGSALKSTSWEGQQREIRLRVLTHDLMLLRRGRKSPEGFQQSKSKTHPDSNLFRHLCLSVFIRSEIISFILFVLTPRPAGLS